MRELSRHPLKPQHLQHPATTMACDDFTQFLRDNTPKVVVR